MNVILRGTLGLTANGHRKQSSTSVKNAKNNSSKFLDSPACLSYSQQFNEVVYFAGQPTC